MPYAPVLTELGGRPGPTLAVAFPQLPPEAATVTVTRTGGGQSLPVRDGLERTVAGALTVVDFEVPIDVESTYRAEMFDAAGSRVGFTDSASTTVWAPSWSDGKPRACIHNPLDPATAVWVRLAPTAGRIMRRPAGGGTLASEGRRLPMLSASRRAGMTDVALDVITESWEAGERFMDLFGTAEIDRVAALCVRIPQALRNTRWPAVWFASALDPEGETNAALDRMTWRIRAAEISPPLPALVAALLTNADLNAYYGTNASLNADNASNLDLNGRYELAGGGA